MIRRWLARYRCWHHNNITGVSWIGRGQTIARRRGKLYRCNHCERTWVK